jgi:hemerythrin-like domain-containing protein
MTERRSQVGKGSTGRLQAARAGEGAERTRSAGTKSKANGTGKRAVRTAAVRGSRVRRLVRSAPAEPARPAGSRTKRTATRARPAAAATSARKPRAAKSPRTKTASRPRAKTQARSAAPRRQSSSARTEPVAYAVKLLKQDHRALLDGAAHFAKALQEDKHQIAERFCKLLALHMQVEEELLYPQAHKALGTDSQRITTAQIEHAIMRDLASQIEDMDEVDELYRAKMEVLTSLLTAHIDEEETGIFPRLDHTSLDLSVLGEQLARRKQELSGDEELVIAYEYEEDEPSGRSVRPRTGAGSRRHVLIHSGPG